jgi:hypothetical protein
MGLGHDDAELIAEQVLKREKLGYQVPAEGISGIGDSFRVECDCGCPEHAVRVELNVNKDDDCTDVIFDVIVAVPFNITSIFRQRLLAGLRLIFTGRLELESSIILRPQVARNFAYALLNSIPKEKT